NKHMNRRDRQGAVLGCLFVYPTIVCPCSRSRAAIEEREVNPYEQSLAPLNKRTANPWNAPGIHESGTTERSVTQ
ncbi:MAG: hypothetical protein QM271_08505, partial [Bacillota bacterium]|nr:hypothetical protein [Bacillota bacterium]